MEGPGREGKDANGEGIEEAEVEEPEGGRGEKREGVEEQNIIPKIKTECILKEQ